MFIQFLFVEEHIPLINLHPKLLDLVERLLADFDFPRLLLVGILDFSAIEAPDEIGICLKERLTVLRQDIPLEVDKLLNQQLTHQLFGRLAKFYRNLSHLLLGDCHCQRSLGIDLRNKLFRKVSLAEIDNVVELKFHIRDAVAVLIDRQSQSASDLLQLADLTAAGPQFGDGEHIRVVPPLLQRPLGKEEPTDIPLAVLILERQQLFLAMQNLIDLLGDRLVGRIVVLGEISRVALLDARQAFLKEFPVFRLGRLQLLQHDLDAFLKQLLEGRPQIGLALVLAVPAIGYDIINEE